MCLSLSTHWNAATHNCGERLVEQARSMGFSHLELGYDLPLKLVPGIRQAVADGNICVRSVHNYCPIPVGAPFGHPELFLLGSLDRRERESAMLHTCRTLEFAAELGATAVVLHAGRVRMRNYTPMLLDLCAQKERMQSPHCCKLQKKMQAERQRKAARHLRALRHSLDVLLPQAESMNIRLGLENLPSWDALPNEQETLQLCDDYDSVHLGYWHDTGHGQIRETLNWIRQQDALEMLQARLIGMHVHDVIWPGNDHVMPPRGQLDFAALSPYASRCPIKVLEPAPGTAPAEIVEAARYIQTV